MNDNGASSTVDRSNGFRPLGSIVRYRDHFGLRHVLRALACLVLGSNCYGTANIQFYTGWKTNDDLYISRNVVVTFPVAPGQIYYKTSDSTSWYGTSTTNGSMVIANILVYRGSYSGLDSTSFKAANLTPAVSSISLCFAFSGGNPVNAFTFNVAPFGGVVAEGQQSDTATYQGIARNLSALKVSASPDGTYSVDDPYDPQNVDTDGDGIPDSSDTDDDNDGIPDAQDPHPLVPAPPGDKDDDGIPNETDPDDDNDGTPNANDPDSPSYDFDHDGVPDSSDPDDDNDGIPDGNDPHPRSIIDPEFPNPDTPIDPDHDDDGDGLPDWKDPHPNDPAHPDTPPPATPPTVPNVPGSPGGPSGNDPDEHSPPNNNQSMNDISWEDGSSKETGVPGTNVVKKLTSLREVIGTKFGKFKFVSDTAIPRTDIMTLSLPFGQQFGNKEVRIDFGSAPFPAIRMTLLAMITLAMSIFFFKRITI